MIQASRNENKSNREKKQLADDVLTIYQRGIYNAAEVDEALFFFHHCVFSLLVFDLIQLFLRAKLEIGHFPGERST